jgi:hypothetical protein
MAPSLSTKQRLGQFIPSGFNLCSSIYAYTLHAAECMGRLDDWDFMRVMYESYNGLAQTYFRALSRTQLERMQRGEVAGRNDSYDLDHFAYLVGLAEWREARRGVATGVNKGLRNSQIQYGIGISSGSENRR